MISTVHVIGKELSKAFGALEIYLSSTQGANSLLRELGWQPVISIPPPLSNLMTDINNLIADVKHIEAAPSDLSKYLTAIQDVQSFISHINSLSSASFSAYSSLVADNFATIFPQQLLDFVICNYVQQYYPVIYSGCIFTGVIQNTYQAPAGYRPAYTKRTIVWANVMKIFSDPGQLMQNIYGWNTTNFDAENFINNLKSFIYSLGVPAHLGKMTPAGQQLLMAPYPNNKPYDKYLNAPLYDTVITSGASVINFLLGVGLYPIMRTYGGAKPGFAIYPYLSGGLATEINVADNLFFGVDANVDVTAGVVLAVFPDTTTFTTNFNTTAAISSNSFLRLYLENRDADGDAILLFGELNGSHFSYQALRLELGAELLGGSNDIYAEVAIKKGQVVMDLSNSDGFISKIFGQGQVEFDFEITLGYSTKRGVYFKGSAGLELEIPLHFTIGPVNIDGLVVNAKIRNNELPIQVGTSVSAQLGPVFVEIDNIGASANLSFPGSGGNLGPLNASFGFKPPNGIGLSVEAKVVSGGGYLYIDTQKGRYYGGAQLKIADKLNVSAVGIVATKAPDGSKGFSMLILVNVSFAPSIPFGFGFSLSGLGGLGGVNRDMSPEAIRLGVKNGGINEIMFPDNVVDNIDHIINDLEQFFPMKEKRYTFGLFFLIDWGVGVPLIHIKLGIIINLPDPVRLAIIGILKISLPTPDKVLLELNVAFAGIIDFEKKYMTFDATIFDSRLLTFSLSGDMAVRLFWGDHKEMVFSVGGFHPAFNPPAYLMLPPMNRLTISFIDEDSLKIKFSTYFAVTSNTLQFGAEIDLDFHVWKVRLVGYFGFDVLFQFNPFHFIAEMRAGIAVYWGSKEIMNISTDISVEGPGLWHAKGSATVKVLCVKKTVHLDKTWGNNANTTLPGVTVAPQIIAAIQDKKNWQADLPADKQLLVTVRPITSTDVVIHPLGVLSVSQAVIPLGVHIDRFGSQRPTDGGVYDITEVKIAGTAQPALGQVQGNFAPAQFRDMNDDQKLKAPSFEYMKSGVKASATNDWSADQYLLRDVAYDVVIVDLVHRNKLSALTTLPAQMVNNFTRGGLVSDNPVSQQTNTLLKKPIYTAAVKQETYKLVSADSLIIVLGTTEAPLTSVLTSAVDIGPSSFYTTPVPAYV